MKEQNKCLQLEEYRLGLNKDETLCGDIRKKLMENWKEHSDIDEMLCRLDAELLRRWSE